MPKQTNRIWKVGMYVRLSQDDKDMSVSNSVVNQTKMLTNYVKADLSLDGINVYQDDGFTGTNFFRPQFIKMISDMENGVIDCIVVKDLSRFGREHIDVDNYLERTFPTKNIRFISIKERLDSVKYPKRMNSIEVPFINLINEAYSRDISNKSKASLQSKRKQGKYVSPKAPYGYIKDPYDKNHLLVDEDVRQNIINIFNWYLQGMAMIEIAHKLNDSDILTPQAYRCINEKGVTKNDRWNTSKVKPILVCDFYTGDMVQGKTSAYNHKVKKRILLPKEEWIVVQNTHEAIVTHEIFDAVQSLVVNIVKPKRNKPQSILARIAVCGNCGNIMVRHSCTKNGVVYNNLVCSTSKKRGNDICSTHIVNEEVVIAIIIEALKKQIGCALNIDRALKKLQENKLYKKTVDFHEEQIKTLKHKQLRIKVLKKGLYEDLKSNIISENEYIYLKTSYQSQLDNIDYKIKEANSKIDKVHKENRNSHEFIDRLKELQNMDTLTRDTVINMVDCIYVYEDKTLDINFKFKDEIKKLEYIIAS